jgi:hypothetical protein
LDGDLLGLFDGDLDNLDNLLGDLLGLVSRHLEGFGTWREICWGSSTGSWMEIWMETSWELDCGRFGRTLEQVLGGRLAGALRQRLGGRFARALGRGFGRRFGWSLAGAI